MSQSSSLHSDCVGMLTPLVACSTAVSERGEQPTCATRKGETGLLAVHAFFSHRRLKGN